MQPTVDLDTIRLRANIRASGQWTMAHAHEFHVGMQRVVSWSEDHPNSPISVLSNLEGLILHTAEIAEQVVKTVAIMKRIRMSQYALVVPSYLMRMQCRRLLDGIEHRIFDSREDAMTWLGWSKAAGNIRVGH